MLVEGEGGDIMQKIVLKAGKTDRYFIQLASVWFLKQSKKYEGILILKALELEIDEKQQVNK